MAQAKKSENLPKAMQEIYQAIEEIADGFSKENLNDEYAQFIRYAVAACRKRPSPLDTGNVKPGQVELPTACAGINGYLHF